MRATHNRHARRLGNDSPRAARAPCPAMNAPHDSLRIAFAGTPEFACPTLTALLDSKHTLVGVLTQPDRPAGRGRGLRASPVKQLAVRRGLPIDQPSSLKTAATHARLIEWQPELLVVVAYGLILPRAVLDLPRLGCVNIHASLLPRWRGAAPIQRAILAGDAQTGVAIMRLEPGLDTGPVYLERRIPIRSGVVAGELHDELAHLGASALIEALPGIASGALVPQPQAASGVTYAHKIDKAEARIDWSRPALELERQVCAFNPWPVAETSWRGEQIRIHRAAAVEPGAIAALQPRAAGAPGTVLALHDEALWVACGAGALAIRELQRAGRRPVSAREFANAVPLDGLRFGS